MKMANKIQFFYPYGKVNLSNRTALKKFMVGRFRFHRIQIVSLLVIFTSDRELLQINRRFLQHDYYTDIITFNHGTNSSVEGEIYISMDRVRRNADAYQSSIKDELHRVIFHGALHLCGFGDKTIKEKAEMRAMENRWLSLYYHNVPRGTKII